MNAPAVRSFLDRYYSAVHAYVEGDDPATTFCSCGSVLLTAVLAESRSVNILVRFTGLPAGFVAVVVLILESTGHDFSLQFADLITAVSLHPEDLEKLEGTLDALMEDYWARMDAHWCDVLGFLRGGISGGRKAPVVVRRRSRVVDFTSKRMGQLIVVRLAAGYK